MKVSAKGNSRFLSQEDVPEPFTAIIRDLRLEKLKSNRGEEEKYVLYFVTGKPMVFNVVNRKTVIAAYGDDSDTWIGKPIEVYVNPDVYMGSERTGGIRVRIPAGLRPAAGPGPRPSAVTGATRKMALAPAPIAPPPPAPPPTLEQLHAQLLAAFDGALTEENLRAWGRWGKQFPFTEPQQGEAEGRFHDALERIALAQAPTRRPARASV